MNNMDQLDWILTVNIITLVLVVLAVLFGFGRWR